MTLAQKPKKLTILRESRYDEGVEHAPRALFHRKANLMKRSILHGRRLTFVKLVLLIGTFLLAAAVDSNQASAQSSLPNYGKGYGFSGGVGWGTLPSTPPSSGSGYAAQFRAGRTPTNTYRAPTQRGYQPYGVRRYGYVPGYAPYGNVGTYSYGSPFYGNGYVPYGYGYNTYGLQLNTYPGGVIQTYRGPIGW